MQSDDQALREIVASPVMLAEATAALPQLKARAVEPASRAAIKTIIGRRFGLYPQPDRDEGMWAEWWADYYDALEGIPPGAVEAAMAAWVKLPDSEFLPKPGKLRELATMTPNRDVRAYTRAKAAVDYEPPRQIPHVPLGDIIGDVAPKVREWPRERTAEDRAAVRRMWEDARDKLTRPKDPAKEFRASPVDMNENGVSLEMQALRARREGVA